MYTAKIIIIAFGLILICIGLAVWANTSVINLSQKAKINKINSFADCASAGYPVQESFPRKCAIPGGKSFIEELDATPEPSFSDFSPDDQSQINLSTPNDLNSSKPSPTPSFKGPATINPDDTSATCVNKCGDQICQIKVCQGTNCPCGETAINCPQDCQ